MEKRFPLQPWTGFIAPTPSASKWCFSTDIVSAMPGESRADMAWDYLAGWRTAGVPPAAVLKAMTTNAAELLRIQKERGAITSGLYADIIAMPASPARRHRSPAQSKFRNEERRSRKKLSNRSVGARHAVPAERPAKRRRTIEHRTGNVVSSFVAPGLSPAGVDVEVA